MLVREILGAISAHVQPCSDVDVPVLLEIVSGRVVLPAGDADDESLGALDQPDKEALLLASCSCAFRGWGWMLFLFITLLEMLSRT